jgi:tRNA-(ms[2]io[6]A)-hydroxylase
MLHLAYATPPGWADRVLPHLDEVLIDHAHCEKRAASTAIGLIFRYPEHPSLAIPLSRLAREELSHFEEVIEAMARRGLGFRRIPPAPYAARLTAVVRDDEPRRAVDTLLCCALIEARSCERMQLLAERLDDADLAKLYRGLLAAEARHFETYVDLARGLRLVPDDEIRRRLDEIAAHEAEVVRTAPPEPRLHG